MSTWDRPTIDQQQLADVFGVDIEEIHDLLGSAPIEHHDEDGSSSAESEDTSEDSGPEDAEEWSDQNTFRDIPFISRPVINAGPAESPIDFFNLLFNTSFITILVNSVNTLALRVLLEATHNSSRINRWKNTNVEEMAIFLALLFHMGTIKLNRINDYWSTHPLFSLCFKNYMSRDRFLLILRCLSFQNHHPIADHNPLPITNPNHYTKPIIDYFNNTMRDIVVPSRNLTIDENVVLWRGRLRHRQYIQGKRHKYGVKMYVLTESTGMCLKMHMYCGSNDPLLSGRGHVDKVVHMMLTDYYHLGYSLYVDNYYTSVALAQNLLDKNTYMTGTLRAKRSGNPSHVNEPLASGSCVSKFNSTGVCVTKYVDRRPVLLISTEHTADI